MNFVCQQCKHPLQVGSLLLPEHHAETNDNQLDSSLVDLAPSDYNMITSSLPPAPSQQLRPSESEKLSRALASASVNATRQRSAMGSSSTPTSPSLRDQGRQSSSHRSPIPPNESFVLLQDSVIRNIPSPVPSPAPVKKTASASKSRQNMPSAAQVPPPPEEVTHPNPSPLSHHLRSTQRLFNLLSSRTEIDHPLCAECTHELLTSLKAQLDETKKERDGYIAFEKETRREREREKEAPSKADVETKIEKLKEEERFAIEQLKAAEKERAQLEDELKALELDEKALEEEEAELVVAPSMMVCFLGTLTCLVGSGVFTMHNF